MAIPEGVAGHAWVVVCTVAAPTLFGQGLVRCLGLHAAHGRLTNWTFAWLVGHYVLAHLTLLWLAAGQPLPGVVLPIGAALGGTVLVRLARRRVTDHRAPDPPPRLAHLPHVVLAVLVVLLLRDCLVTNVEPIRFSDEAQIWAAKAKALYAAPIVPVRLGLAALVSHADYPLWNPLIQVLSFASAGRILHFENRLAIQFFGVALLLLLAAGTTRRCHPVMAALLLASFAGTLFWSGTLLVYADVMLGFATLALVESLLRLRETGDPVWWRLGCIAAAAMLASKNEGAMLTVAVAVPFAVGWFFDRRRAEPSVWMPRRGLPWLLVPLAAIALHRGFNRWFDLKNDLLDAAASGGIGLFDRILTNGPAHAPKVAAFYGRMLIDPSTHRWLPLLFLVAGLVALASGGRLTQRVPAVRLLAAVVIAMLGYMLVFVGTNSELQWHMETAAARTLQQIVALAALGLGMVAWPRTKG